MSKMTWFKVHHDIVDDEKLRLLSFEDRWHFVALCALKCGGVLGDEDDPLLERKIAVKLGLQSRELDEVKRRLMEVGLVGENYHPLKWDKRQYNSPNLPKGENLQGYKGYVYFIADKAMQTVKIGYSKNPWARVKDLQTGRATKLSVVATVKTTDSSESTVHKLFEEERQSGEWFTSSPRIQSLIEAIKRKEVKDVDGVVSYVATTVATTKETETDTDTDISPKGDCASGDALTPDEVVGDWNELAAKYDLPRVRKLTDSRRRRLKARLRQYPEIEDWQRAFSEIANNKWMHGDNPKGWRADFDFLLQDKSFTKLTEGAYGQAD